MRMHRVQNILKKQREADEKRDRALGEYGIKVKRYRNKDIKQNFRGVCFDILRSIGIDEQDVEWRCSMNNEKSQEHPHPPQAVPLLLLGEG